MAELKGRARQRTELRDSEAFRSAYRVLAEELASGVAVVAAHHRGRDHAVTVTGWLDVSWYPPTLAVSLFEEARICEAVEGAGSWTLSVLNRGQEGIATWLASPGNPVDGLLQNVPFRRVDHGGAPVIESALAWFQVETDQIHTAATHRLVIGRVIAMGKGGPPSSAESGEAAATAGPDLETEGIGKRPLVHWGRSFHGLD